MALANTTNYTLTVQQIIKDAFIDLEMVGENDVLPADYYSRGLRKLNQMIMLWSMKPEPIHLWLQTQGYIFLNKGQATYTVGQSPIVTPGAADLTWTTIASQDLIITKSTATANTSATTIVVNSITNISATQNIGILLDTGVVQWTTIVSINTGTLTITLHDALTSQASTGAKIYCYTNNMYRPKDISSIRLHRKDDSEIPINKLSSNEYFNYVNKTTTGSPNVYYADMQLNYCNVFLYPVPDGTDPFIGVTYRRLINKFTGPTDTPDYPDEWSLPLSSNLAVFMASGYGLSANISMQNNGEASLTQVAAQSLQALSGANQEDADINMFPNLYFYNYD